MGATGQQATAINQDKMMELAFRAVGDAAASLATALVHVGDKLGIFKAMDGAGPMTSHELATKTGLNERYVREWLRAMTTSGYVEYDPASNQFTLTPEAGMVFANEDSPVFVAGMAQMMPDHYRVLPKTIEAFRNGGGVAYSDFGEDTFIGTERLFRTGYVNFMAQVWMPAMPSVHKKLQTGARVADVGCGRGQALLQMAKAFPKSQFIGYDNYAPNIAYANELAKQHGLDGRLRFEAVAANLLPNSGDFDLVMTCDALHDMVSPEACARGIHGMLKADGTWFCIEPNVADELEKNINPLGKLFFSVSTIQCMSCSLAHGGAGYGAGMGAANVKKVAELAGFKHFHKLAIENPFNQFFEIKK